MLAPRRERRQGSCQTDETEVYRGHMSNGKQEAIIYARVQLALRRALERERKRMSKIAGAEVKTSAVIRAILEQKLLSKRSTKSAA